tara:strand:+ start:271 stop:2580 length:2310 start_codon:yes stop_codon:yes gene_type:complete
MATNPMNSFLAGGQMVGGMEQAQTTALGNQLARKTLKENDELKKWNSDLEVLKGAGIVTEEDNGNIVLNVDAIDKLKGLTEGNRTGVSNSLLMNEMMGQYHGEQDGKLIKKKNRQVFAPTLAKSGAVPRSVMEAAAAGDANAIELKKQYEAGTLQGYVTPAINQEGRFSLLNFFGTDKADDTPTVYTKSQIEAGLQARVDKFNMDADRLLPDRAREIGRVEKTNTFDLTSVGGAGDMDYGELVTGVFDENVGRGTTHAFLQNLETIYNANPKFAAEEVAASTQDPTIEPGSEQDVMVSVQGAPKTFEQAYPSLVGLDGETLANEINRLVDAGEFNQISAAQQSQIFKDLQEEGIASTPDLLKKRQDEGKNPAEQYKELLLINTVAARPDSSGKLVLPNGQTPKEATDGVFNDFYSGVAGGGTEAFTGLATAQNQRSAELRARQAGDTAEQTAKTDFYKAQTERLEQKEASALEWAEFAFKQKKYYDGLASEYEEGVRNAFGTINSAFTDNTQKLKTGNYNKEGGIPFVTQTENLREIMKAGGATRRRDPEMPEKATQFRVFVNDLDSISLDYYNASRKNELGKQYVDTAEKAFLAIAGDDETARANLQKMWDKDGHNIYTYNYAQPGRYLEHKQMQEEVILQKVFNSLENDETIWNAIFGGIPVVRNIAGKGALRGGQTLSDYWGDVWANDLSSGALVNSLKDILAVRYEEGKPVEIVAKSTAGKEELEESVELAKFIANGSITGDELNWLMQNLDAIGDTDLPNSDEG